MCLSISKWCKLLEKTDHPPLQWLCLPLIEHRHARSPYSVRETAAIIPFHLRSCGRCCPVWPIRCWIVQAVDARHRRPKVGRKIVQRAKLSRCCGGCWITLERVFPMGPSGVVQQNCRSYRVSFTDGFSSCSRIHRACRRIPSLAQTPHRSSAAPSPMNVTIRIYLCLPQLNLCGRCPISKYFVDPLVLDLLHRCGWRRMASHFHYLILGQCCTRAPA